ncbi:MAG: SDR family NAD(P)-dependent oxidoreductase [Pseudomonadota bacterium]
MNKTVLLTGGTDGIGFETAKRIVQAGHTLLLHGRSQSKLDGVQARLEALGHDATIHALRADLSKLSEVRALAKAVTDQCAALDVLINNAGVFKVPSTTIEEGIDIRLMVNTIAPYVLTQALLPMLSSDARVINLSSAAQAPVNLQGWLSKTPMSDGDAYAQSKLAITMWTFHMAQMGRPDGPALIAVNPASFLGSKMVKQAYGSDGKSLSIGADILMRAAFDEVFGQASGRYFDNDQARFTDPHPDALNPDKNAALVAALEQLIAELDG